MHANELCIFGASCVPSHKSSRKGVALLHVFVSCLVVFVSVCICQLFMVKSSCESTRHLLHLYLCLTITDQVKSTSLQVLGEV